MAPAASVAALPPEVLHRIFGGWGFRDLLPILGVCSFWRHIVFDHPAYYQPLVLSSTKTGAVQLFTTCLSRARSKPIYIFVGVPFDQVLPPTILPLVAEHLCHVSWLHIHVDVKYAPEVLGIFQCRAPVLVNLRIEFHMDAVLQSPLLPEVVFSGRAPLLDRVGLVNIRLPTTAIDVFQQVTEVAFGITTADEELPDLFYHFPRMSTLILCGSPVLSSLPCGESDQWGRIRIMLLMFPEPTLVTAIKHLPLARIAYVRVAHAGGWPCSLLTSDLQGSLQVTLRDHPPGIFTIQYMDESGRVRSFSEDASKWIWRSPLPNNLLTNVHLINPITVLSLPNSYWSQLVPICYGFPVLEQFRIVLHDTTLALNLEFSSLSYCIECPRLQLLIIRCESDVLTLRGESVANFAQSGIAFVTFPIPLYLENTLLDGHCATFGDYFSTVTFTGLQM